MPAILAALGFVAGPFQAPPPPYFLTGYQRQAAVSHITIDGPVQQPETAMFRIAQLPRDP